MNERLFDELSYCVPLGIPHSFFLGGPYRWTELDQDKALAYEREMRKVCKGCGTRASEWEQDPDVYIGDLAFCPGCERLEAEQDNMPEDRRGYRARLLPRLQALALVDSYAEPGGEIDGSP